MSGRFSTNVDMLNTLTSELPEGFSLCREICNAEYLSISQVFYVRWSMFPMIPACQHVLPSGLFRRACILHGILGLSTRDCQPYPMAIKTVVSLPTSRI